MPGRLWRYGDGRVILDARITTDGCHNRTCGAVHPLFSRPTACWGVILTPLSIALQVCTSPSRASKLRHERPKENKVSNSPFRYKVTHSNIKTRAAVLPISRPQEQSAGLHVPLLVVAIYCVVAREQLCGDDGVEGSKPRPCGGCRANHETCRVTKRNRWSDKALVYRIALHQYPHTL